MSGFQPADNLLGVDAFGLGRERRDNAVREHRLGDSFHVFDQIFVLSRPRPSDATITIVYFIYENGFKFFKMGYATAASWILFVIVAVFTAIYFRSQNRWVHYQ